MNPPFNAAANPSPEARRSLAHSAAHDTLRQWTRTASRLLRANGVLTLIWRADGLGEVLDVLASDFGAMALLPVHPKPAAPAVRVLVRAVKASRAPLRLLPGLLLADADGKPSEAAEAVLRGGAVLPLAAAS
jgi:tRNA1(Val) A37 N6-methylase TrmN6